MSVAIAPWRPQDADALFAALSDPAIYTWLDEDPPADPAEIRARIERTLRGPRGGDEVWLNWCVRRDGAVVGYTQATVDHMQATLAYVLSPAVWGTGVARTACALTIDTLRAHHGVTRLLADTETGNLRSQGLLDRLGFRETHRTTHEVFYARAAR